MTDLDKLFDLIDDLMKQGRTDYLNAIVSLLADGNDIDNMVAVLTMTLPVKSKLSARKRLFDLAASVNSSACSEDLRGLE